MPVAKSSNIWRSQESPKEQEVEVTLQMKDHEYAGYWLNDPMVCKKEAKWRGDQRVYSWSSFGFAIKIW